MARKCEYQLVKRKGHFSEHEQGKSEPRNTISSDRSIFHIFLKAAKLLKNENVCPEEVGDEGTKSWLSRGGGGKVKLHMRDDREVSHLWSCF